jgi:hypothetical protein
MLVRSWGACGRALQKRRDERRWELDTDVVLFAVKVNGHTAFQ